MNIPYADPRHSYHKKAAFDLGDAGAGIMANNLQLGCDCLGSIHYLSAALSDNKGNPFDMPNVVCIHKQDNGIGWKHTNYRTGSAAVVRNRELLLQSIITVSNYEYFLLSSSIKPLKSCMRFGPPTLVRASARHYSLARKLS